MYFKHSECDADLDQFPEIERDIDKVVLGDIHGNAQYLLYLLIKFNVIELTESQYKELSRIYNQSTSQLTASRLKTFRRILKEAKYNTDVSLLFLGDTLSDRGRNDFFTLCIFRRLARSRVPFSILLANHDYEFLNCFEQFQKTGTARFLSNHILSSQASSMANLHQLMQLNLQNRIGMPVFSKEDLGRWVSSYLIDHYKAIEYDVDKDGITIFSHAPIDINIILGIADELGVDKNDETHESLTKTIDGINEKITQLLKANQLCQQFTGMVSSENLSSTNVDPLTRLIWNRDYDSLDHSLIHNGYKVNFVHGHDSKGPRRKNVTSLDKKLGKTKNHNSGTLHYLYLEGHKPGFFRKKDSMSSEPEVKTSLVMRAI